MPCRLNAMMRFALETGRFGRLVYAGDRGLLSMPASASTCWTVIRAAAAGSPDERTQFVDRYAPVIRTYLAARWRSCPLTQEIEDAIQEVFIDCFRQNGVLER